MDFPSNAPVTVDKQTYPWRDELAKAILGSNRLDSLVDVQLSPNLKYILLRLRDDIDLTQVKPHFDLMSRINTNGLVKLAMITRKLNPRSDTAHFEARVFAPWLFVNEDPVCGSAFTVMTPFWDKIYRKENNETVDTFYTKQVSRQGGLIQSQNKKDRVFFGGQVKLFSKGVFYL